MARWADVAVLLALVAAPGCFTGHLLDRGRRVESPVAFRDVVVAGDRLLVRYDAVVTDDLGAPLGEATRWASVPLAELRGRASVAADALDPEWLDDAAARAAGGTALALCPADPAADAAACAVAGPRAAVTVDDDGSNLALRVVDAPLAPLPATALTRIETAPWVWPLVPVAVAIDVVTTPPLVLASPVFFLFGD